LFGGTKLGARKPLDMMIALTAEVGNPLAPEECKVPLNACADGTCTECLKLLSMLLTINYCGFELGAI
jgi:hypothetical protein